MTVTQAEIDYHVAAAFRRTPTTRTQIIAAARRSEAPAAVMAQLHHLPARAYDNVSELWAELPDLPRA